MLEMYDHAFRMDACPDAGGLFRRLRIAEKRRRRPGGLTSGKSPQTDCGLLPRATTAAEKARQRQQERRGGIQSQSVNAAEARARMIARREATK